MSKLNATIDFKDTETFVKAIKFIAEIISDERIPKEIRAEYAHKYNEKFK